MSSKFKKLLMGLVLVPSLTLTAACGKDGDTEKGAASNAKAYETLQTLSNDMLDESNVIAFDVTSESGMTVDFGDTSKYSDVVQAALTIVAKEYEEEPEIEKEKYGYDFTNGVGYGVSTYESEDESYIEDAFYIIKNGDNYVLYKTDYNYGTEQNENSAFYVNGQHLKELYSEDLEEYLYLLELVSENDKLEDLKTAISEYINKEIEDEEDEEGTTFTISDFKLTKTKGVYTLKFVASAEMNEGVFAEDEPEEDDGPKMIMDIDFAISFNSKKIIEISSGMSISYSQDFELGSIEPSLTDVLSMTVSMYTNVTVDNFSNTLDSTIMEADYSSFGIIVNSSSQICYYAEGDYISCVEGSFGDDLTLLANGDEKLGKFVKGTISSWYLDEECTIPVADITEFPSYNMMLYGKVTGVKEGYALIRSKLTASYDYTAVKHDFINVSEVTTMTLAQLKASFAPMVASNIKVNGTAVEDDYVFNFTSGTIFDVECDFTYAN